MEIVPISSSSSNSSSSSSSSDDNELSSDDNWTEQAMKNDPIFFPLMQNLIFDNRRYRVENYVQLIESWTNMGFIEHLRLRKNIAYQLIGKLLMFYSNISTILHNL